MSDLRLLLDRAAGHPPDLPDVDLIRRRGDVLRVRRRVRRTVAALAACLLVAAGAALTQQDLPRPSVPAGEPGPGRAGRLVTNACATVGTPAGAGIAVTSTRPDSTRAIDLVTPGGGAGRCLVDTAGTDGWPAWSPDGQWLAFVGGDGVQDDVYVVRADGSDLSRVTDSAAAEEGPAWSPDGSRLAYTVRSGTGVPSVIHVVGRDGRSDRVLLRGPRDGMVALEDWSPDGGTLLFIRDDSAEGGHIALWAMSPDGSGQRLLRAEEGDVGPGARYSPDGTQLAFQADLDGGCVYRSDPLATRLTRVTTGCRRGGSLGWSPDGTQLVLTEGDQAAGVVVVDVASDRRRTVTTGSTVSHVDWRPASTDRPAPTD